LDKSVQKTCLVALTLLCLLASACAPTATKPPAALAAVSPAAPTPTLSPAPTETRLPTLNPSPPTTTPLPTIPIFTPTFDVRTIVTSTPAPKAECPKENLKLVLDLGLAKTRECFRKLTGNDNPDQCKSGDIQEKILNFLNAGGNIASIVSQLITDDQQENQSFIYKDLNNDRLEDFVFQDKYSSLFGGFNVYSCSNGLYKVQVIFGGDENAKMSLNAATDLEADGIPEILITAQGVLIIFKWNGDSFEEKMRIEEYGEAYFSTQDIDGNGTLEIIVIRGFPPNWKLSTEFPWRSYRAIYEWNGSSFVLFSKEFDPPIYQFQAIQDADQHILSNKYSKAMALYQGAIFNHKLEWFSSAKRNYLLKTGLDLEPTPAPDPAEYPKLAAYAYYRMVILHTKLGEMDAAQTQYTTLQENFPADSPGHPYAEMANAFWETYQSKQNITDACGAAIQYAAENPEILSVLGSDYHGWQSHKYVPADVCPFR
jgi:hypothetical protein